MISAHEQSEGKLSEKGMISADDETEGKLIKKMVHDIVMLIMGIEPTYYLIMRHITTQQLHHQDITHAFFVNIWGTWSP